MKRKILLLLVVVLAMAQAGASKLSQNIGKLKNGYNFWLYTPDGEGEEQQAKPLFIFLHGASLCGNNLDKVRRYGTIDAIEKGRDIDAYVIAPQNPGGAWNPDKVMNIVDWVCERHNVDSTRVYVLGMSLGGYGTIDLAATYPDRIAAAMALCGGGTVKNLGNLNDVPLWIVHGTADRAVSVNESDKVVSAMKSAAGGKAPRLLYDRIPGMNHSQPARMFYLPDSYQWLLSHSLADEQRDVADGFDLSQSKLKSAYKGLNMRAGRTSKATKKSSKHSKRKRSKSRRR